MVAIKINNEFISLNEKSSFGLNFSVGDIGDLSTRSGAYSYSFNVPLTRENSEIFGFIENTGVNTALKPSKKIDAEIHQNGNIVSKGYINILEVSDSIKCVFFTGNSEWIDQLKSVKLYNTDLTDFRHVWNEANVIASFNNTWEDCYIYPYINYEDKSTSSTTYNVEQFPVAVFAKFLIKRIFESIGYKVSGSWFENSYELTKLILPSYQSFTDVNGDRARFVRDFSATDFNMDRVMDNDGGSLAVSSEVKWTFDQLTPSTTLAAYPETTPLYWSFTNQRYETDIDIGLQIDLNVRAVASFVIQPGSAAEKYVDNALLVVKKNGVDLSVGTASNVSVSTLLLAGDYLEFYVRNSSGTVVIPQYKLSGGLVYTAQVEYNERLEEGSIVSPNFTLPEMTQATFIKNIMLMYGVFCDVNVSTKTVSFFQFDDLIKNKQNSIDWSDKLDSSYKGVRNYSRVTRKYGKTNYLKYKSDDKDPTLESYKNLYGLNFGTGSFEIDNDFIQKERDVVSLDFAPTASGRVLNKSNIWAALIPSQYELFPRLLYVNRNAETDLYLDEANITIGATSTSVIAYASFESRSSNGYFFDVDLKFTSSSSRNTLIEQYSDLINILNNSYYLTEKIYLDDLDILNLDFSVPIYLEQYKAHFFVNNIKNYKADNKPVTVELIKI